MMFKCKFIDSLRWIWVLCGFKYEIKGQTIFINWSIEKFKVLCWKNNITLKTRVFLNYESLLKISSNKETFHSYD